MCLHLGLGVSARFLYMCHVHIINGVTLSLASSYQYNRFRFGKRFNFTFIIYLFLKIVVLGILVLQLI